MSGISVLNTVFEVVGKNTVYGQWRCARKPSFGTGCICCLLPTFGWRLACGQCLLLPAHSVEKHHVAGAEISVLNRARAPFLSGFARLLRCRKDLG